MNIDINLQNIILYYFLSLITIPFISYLGNKKIIQTYMGFTTYITDNKKNYYKWAEYWVLLNPLISLSLSFLFYEIGRTDLIRHVWLITPFYWFNLYIYISLILRRKKLLDHKDFLLIAILSSLISYGVYRYIILVGPEFILPNFENIRDLFWLGSVGYLFYALNRKKEEQIETRTLYKEFLLNRLKKYTSEYKKELESLVRSEQKHAVLTIMFFEDFNRPITIRKVEFFLARFGIAKTTGISQFGLNINDKVSVKKLISWVKSLDENDYEYEYIRNIFITYNGKEYADECWNIYSDIKDLSINLDL